MDTSRNAQETYCKNWQVTNWHEKHETNRTVSQRVADLIADAAGSWIFFFIHVIWFTLWIVLKVEPFPFGLLTMIVSLEAIFLSTFILISQNRQSERDRAQAAADYETNLAAKAEIEQLMRKLDSIEQHKLDRILSMLEK